jgi:uncharacterized protein YecE (DUF72 family)
LSRKQAALCWAESEKISAPNIATASFLYYRFRRPEYSRPALESIAEQLIQQSTDKDVFAFFKHEENPESALNAVAVARMAGIQEQPFEFVAARRKAQP